MPERAIALRVVRKAALHYRGNAMFDIRVDENGNVILSGRMYASRLKQAGEILSGIDETTTIDFQDLDYISSAGIELLLSVQKRLREKGETLRLVHLDPFIRDIFHFADLESVFNMPDI